MRGVLNDAVSIYFADPTPRPSKWHQRATTPLTVGYSELIRVKATCHPAEPNLMALLPLLVWQASFLDGRTYWC
jgi:hypothetical protein